MREQQILNYPFGQIQLLATGTSNLNKRVINLEPVVEEQLTLDYQQQRVLRKEMNSKVSFVWKNGIDFADCMKGSMKKGKIYSRLYINVYMIDITAVHIEIFVRKILIMQVNKP
ncbi:hypothetical protein COD78_31725 [Bacillus cereus]|nr:hypothetical protein [Bacillus cereus]PEX03438.1 hypothetical protein CN454_31910 [Bacillus cereus]PGV16798.1 hypothetical protein COD78_31725 [Bacillus cereus]